MLMYIQGAVIMTIYTHKWGNSQGIRIPKKILDKLNIKNSDPLEIKEENGQIIISKENVPIDLSEELEKCDRIYQLTEEDKDWLNAKPVGNEIWW